MNNHDLRDNLIRFSTDFSYKIIMDDLNADLMSASSDAKYVRDLAAELCITLVNYDATHLRARPILGLTYSIPITATSY